MCIPSRGGRQTAKTPADSMFGLAGPSQGGAEVDIWRVELDADSSTPFTSSTANRWDAAVGLEVDGRTGRAKAARRSSCPSARCGSSRPWAVPQRRWSP